MKSTYMANKSLDGRYGGTNFTQPATVYIALSTADPTVSGGGLAEPSGGNYSRLAVTNNATNFPAASGGAKSNGAIFQFATPSAGWGAITHVATFDASSGGNMLDFAALAVPKTINSGDDVEFPVGEFDLTET